MSEKRILIVGGGFAGVHAAVGASETLGTTHEGGISVEVVSPDPYLVIRPRLYEANLSGVRVPLSGVLGPIGVKHRQAKVTEIDVATRTVRLDPEPGRIGFDQLVFAAGSRLPLPADQHLHAADTYPQALALQRAVGALARRPDAHLRAVVIGGGFTGVELAAELAGTLKRAARSAGPHASGHVTLIERGRDLALAFGPRARRVIAQALAELGVEVRTGVGVSDSDRDGVTLEDGSRIDAELVVWAAGPRASEITAQIPAHRDSLGRLLVDEFLATEVQGIWAAGDSAAASADGEHIAVMSCQHAVPQGRRAGENAAAAALGKPARPYRQPLYVTCLDLGDSGALLTWGFDRNTVLATGDQAKKFKRFINRSLIYPPQSADRDQMLTMGRPGPVGPAVAALAAVALRSDRVRDRITRGAQDRASMFAGPTGDAMAHPPAATEDPRQAAA